MVKDFGGTITSYLHREQTGKEIVKLNKINSDVAKKIIRELNEIQIYNIKDENDKIECGDYYLDGDYFSIIIENKSCKIKLEKVFDEIYPESESKIEENECRRKAQLVATIIDNELNLKGIYSKHFKKSGRGTCY